MKMKIIVVLIFFSLLIFISYLQSNKSEINYTVLGEKDIFSSNLISKNFSELIYDELKQKKEFGFYSKEFIKNDIRIIDVINSIDNNEKIDNITIQNILKRTNLLILNIGNNEINYKLSKLDENENNDSIVYKYLDDVLKDLEYLIMKIINFSDENIIILGYYNDTNIKSNDKYYKYVNEKADIISKKNKIEYLNLYDVLNKNEDYLTKTNPIYITSDGNIALFNKIYSKIDELYLHKKY